MLSLKFLQLLAGTPASCSKKPAKFHRHYHSQLVPSIGKLLQLHKVFSYRKMGFFKENFITMATLLGVIAGKFQMSSYNKELIPCSCGGQSKTLPLPYSFKIQAKKPLVDVAQPCNPPLPPFTSL